MAGEVRLGTGSRWRIWIPWASAVREVDAGKSRGRQLIALGKLLRIDSQVEFRPVAASSRLCHLGVQRLHDGRQTVDHSRHRLAGIGHNQHHQVMGNPIGHPSVAIAWRTSDSRPGRWPEPSPSRLRPTCR